MYMNYLTTTQLRTKSSDLVDMLLAGESVELIHRSKVIGEVNPKKAEGKVFNAKKMLELAKKMNLPKLSYKERERRYRQHLERKYGKGISRH